MSIDRSICSAKRHGDYRAYRRGCRCIDAREDRRLYAKRLREGRQPAGWVPAVGAIRRLRALSAIGWSPIELAARLDTTPANVLQLRLGRCQVMSRLVHQRVARLYEELSGTPGTSTRVRTYASRRGWAAPLLWDDTDIDNPTAQPAVDEPVRTLTRVDLDEVAFFTSLGLSLEEIAGRLHVRTDAIRAAQRRHQQQHANLAHAPSMRRALNETFGGAA